MLRCVCRGRPGSKGYYNERQLKCYPSAQGVSYAIHVYACAPLIDGLGQATPSATYPSCSAHRLAATLIVGGFRAALDLDTYPLSNLICPRCAEWVKPGRGKPVLIMYIGFFACFSRHISRTQSFQQIATFFFLPL